MGAQGSLGMEVSELGAASINRGFARHILRDAPSPGEVQGEGFWWQDPSGGGGEGGLKGSLLFVPPACGFPSSSQGGRRRSAPAWRNAAIVWVSPSSFLPGVPAPAWAFWGFPAGPELPSQPEFQNPSRAGWVLPGPGLAGCTLFLNPLLSCSPDPTSKPCSVCGARGSCSPCCHPGRVA